MKKTLLTSAAALLAVASLSTAFAADRDGLLNAGEFTEANVSGNQTVANSDADLVAPGFEDPAVAESAENVTPEKAAEQAKAAGQNAEWVEVPVAYDAEGNPTKYYAIRGVDSESPAAKSEDKAAQTSASTSSAAKAEAAKVASEAGVSSKALPLTSAVK